MGLLGYRLIPKVGGGVAQIVNNTFLGNVSSYITNPTQMAAHISITSANVTNFIIDGPNISCYIDADYTVGASSFINDYNITYYKDYDGHCTGINDRAFRSGTLYAGQLYEIFLPNCLDAFNTYHLYRRNEMRELVMPRLERVGPTVDLNDNFFTGGTINSGSKGWFPVALQTINGGGVEFDIQNMINEGMAVTWVTNYTASDPVSDLAVSAIYEDGVQLTWSTPSSTNGVYRYEVWVNGQWTVYKTTGNTIKVPYLTNGVVYRFEVKVIDNFFNISSLSNAVYSIINGPHIDWSTLLMAYYKFDSDVLDSYGSYDGTATDITYEPGIIGNAASFNGTTSQVDLGAGNIIRGRSAFTIATVFKMIVAENGTIIYGCWVAPYSILIRIEAGFLQFYTMTALGQRGGSFTAFTDTTTLHHLVCTYDGYNMKMYLDKVLVKTVVQNGSILIGGENEAWGKGQATNFGNILLDGGVIFSDAINQADVDAIYDIQMGGTDLI